MSWRWRRNYWRKWETCLSITARLLVGKALTPLLPVRKSRERTRLAAVTTTTTGGFPGRHQSVPSAALGHPLTATFSTLSRNKTSTWTEWPKRINRQPLLEVVVVGKSNNQKS